MTWQRLRGCLGVAGLVGCLTAQSALAQESATIPIRKISVDNSKQMIVEFATNGGAFPSVPHVLDLPGPNHRVVLDFTDATVDKASMPAPEELSATLAHSLPFVKGVRYSNLANTNKPTARVVLDLPETVTVKPRVVKLEEGQITIDFGAEGEGSEPASANNAGSGFDTTAAPAATTTAAESTPTPVAESVPTSKAAESAPTPAAESAPISAVESAPTSAVESAPTSAVESAPTSAANTQSTKLASAPTPTSESAPAEQTHSAPAGQQWDWSAGNASANQGSAIPVSTGGSGTDDSTDVGKLKPELPLGNPPLSTGSSPALRGESITDNASATSEASTTSETPPSTEPAQATAQESALPPDSTPSTPASAADQPKSGNSNVDAVKKYNSAVQNHLSGKLVDAVSDYQSALKLNPNLSEAHSNLGLIYNQQHNYAQALSEFRKALAINPRDAITYNGIGAALRAQKDLLGAIKNWQTAVSLDSHLATAHYNLGTAYEIQKDYDKAVESYKQAVKNDYRLGEAYYRMGLIMERKHRTDEAAEQFTQALKVSSNSEYSEDARQRLAFLTQTKKGTRK